MAYFADLRLRKDDDRKTRARKKKTASDLLALRKALKEEIGAAADSQEGNAGALRIATWNIREFDSTKCGPRLEEAIYYMAEIISHFDIVAVQEVRRDLTAFRHLHRILGYEWQFVMTDAAEGGRQNRERMAFLYNSSRVSFRGIAGELTLSEGERLFLPNSFDLLPRGGVEIEVPDGDGPVPPQKVRTKKARNGRPRIVDEVTVDLPAGTKLTLVQDCQLVFKGQPDELQTDNTLDLGSGRMRTYSESVGVRWPTEQMRTEDFQFARTPFIVYFQAGWIKLALCTVHIFYGDEDEGSLKMARRKAEIAALTKALARKAEEEHDSDADTYFVVLGDFNIVRPGHGTMAALEDNDFVIPEEIKAIPTGSNVRRDKFYDQIAFWMGKPRRRQHFREYTEISVRRAGVFDFFRHVFREGDDDENGTDERYYRGRMVDIGAVYKSYLTWRTFHMSDHLPMWVEIDIDFSDTYLGLIAGEEADG